MTPELQAKWDEATRTGKPVPVGNLVVCDVCDQDFTTRPDPGGFIFGSYAYCPKCAEEGLKRMKRYREEHLIRAHANPGEAFADFVRRYRGRDSVIKVGPLDIGNLQNPS